MHPLGGSCKNQIMGKSQTPGMCRSISGRYWSSEAWQRGRTKMPRKGKNKIIKKKLTKKRKIGEEKEMVPTGFCKAEESVQNGTH